jgi:fumarate hydratase class II
VVDQEQLPATPIEADVISQVCDEVTAGELDDHFPL